MKILAFAASGSSKSINKQLISHAADILKADIIKDAEIEILDINDYEMPIYSSDREEAGGIPDLAQQFATKIGTADALLISYAEHNGNYTAAYKNLFDWTSRLEGKVFQDKPMVIMATSPGPGGASNVLAMAKTSAPFFGAEVKADLSIASFYDVFDVENGQLKDADIQAQMRTVLAALK
ncbi:MAG: NAD(P)H-dependent oxidoreductase [Amylibacter sp.]|nr:NAD(P)H-dependent oxidoreductase [Amylibacter sp.]